MTLATPAQSRATSPALAPFAYALRMLDRIPYWLLAIPLRVAAADVFWRSAWTHVASWQTTLYQFSNDYYVPLLSPTLAAYLAVTIEFTTPPLLAFGLATRLASLVLLGMIAVIEIFVYPQAWPTHIEWAAMLLVLVARGPGSVSVDGVIRRYALGRHQQERS